MDRICNACGMKIDENNYLKRRTICKNCHNKSRKNKNSVIQNENSGSHQQSKIDNDNNSNKIIFPEKQKHNNTSNISTYENHRHVFFYMLNLLPAQSA